MPRKWGGVGEGEGEGEGINILGRTALKILCV